MKFNKNRQTHFKVDESGKICVVYIRKNACSALKAMILDDIGDLGAGKTDTQRMAEYRLCNFEEATSARVRSFIIRDPLHRVISGWLNQVVQKIDRAYPEMFDGITDAVGKHPRDVTFNDFLKLYLTRKKINGHFTPVVNHLYPMLYTHVLHDQSLYDDARIAFGNDLAQKNFLRPTNATGLLKSEHVEGAYNFTAGEIFDAFKERSILPSKDSFSSPQNIEIINDIYSDDVSVYKSYIKERIGILGPISIDFSDR